MSFIYKIRKFADYGIGVFSGLSAVLFNFLIQIILVRLLGVASFGLFALWRNNVQLAAALGSYSMNTLALKRMSTLRVGQDKDGIFAFRRISSFLTIVLATGTGILAAKFLVPDQFAIVATIAAVVGLAMIFVWAAGNRAVYGGVVVLFVERALQPLLFLIVVSCALVGWFDPDLTTLGWLFVSTVVLTLVIVLIGARKQPDFEEIGQEVDEDISMVDHRPLSVLKDATPYFFISIASFASARMPLLLSATILTAKELGQFAFMLSLAGLVSVTLFSINMVAAPKIASAHASGDHAGTHAVVRQVRWMALGLAAFAATSLWFLQPLFGWLTGNDDIIIPPVFGVLLAASFLSVILAVPAFFMQMTERQILLAKVMNAGVLIKVVILVPMGMQFGLVGIAIGELIQAIFIGTGVSVIYNHILRKKV